MLRRALPFATLAVLAFPAGAAATTYTVDPSAADGCNAANVCKSPGAANGKVADGDTVVIKDGTYNEPGPITVAKKNVTFKAENPGKAVVTQLDAKTDTPVFTLAEGTTLDGLVVSVQKNGAEAVVAAAKGAVIKNASLIRAQVDTTDAPVLAATAADGVITLQTSFVLQTPQTPGDVKPAAIVGNATSSIAISDAVILAGAGAGPGVVYAGGTGNTITRTQVYAIDAAANALNATSAAGETHELTVNVDSSVLASGTNGTAIAALSDASDLDGGGKAVTITGKHLTIAGGTKPVSATANTGTAVGVGGPVKVELDRSIVHGKVASTVTTGSALVDGDSTATIKISNSDATDAAATGITVAGNTKSTDAELFADPAKLNFHLRVGSPAIDRGGAAVGGESDKDIDQQPRSVGNATDQGADEFVNLPPKASFTANPPGGQQGVSVAFDGSKSVDPDAGGGIKTYRWDFGDGQSADTTTPATTHAYGTIGTFTPTLTVIDNQGNASAPATGAPIAITDGTAPAVAITSPKNGATRHIFKTTRKKGAKPKRTRQQFTFKGTSADDAGIAKVEVSLRRVSLAKSAATACIFLDGKTSFVSKGCKKPLFFVINANADGSWTYKTKKGVVFRPGTYEFSARATDKNGVVSAPVKITLTLKK